MWCNILSATHIHKPLLNTYDRCDDYPFIKAVGAEWETKWGELKEVDEGSPSALHNISHLVHFSQSLTAEEPAVQEPARATEIEDIHYGEIDFSKQRSEPASVQDSGQQQDTLYAQVKVSQPANRLTQTADGPEDLYAQVKKKWLYGRWLFYYTNIILLLLLFQGNIFFTICSSFHDI